LPSAIFGILTVLGIYFLAAKLFSAEVGLLSAFLLATSFWHINFSRIGFRAIMAPFFLTWATYLLIKGLELIKEDKKLRRAIFWHIAGGIVFGLGFYTYISYRMMVPFFAALILILALAYRGQIKELIAANKKYLAGALGGFAAAFAWIGYYFFQNPQALFARIGHVSIFSKDLNQGDVLGTFFLVLKKTMLAFFTEGDLNWRHNVASYPFLPPILSPFFAVALLIFTIAFFVLIKQAWDKKINAKIFYMGALALWFWLMLVPEITTAEGIPHGLRLVGVIPTMFIMPAWAIHELWKRLKAKTMVGRFGKVSYAVIILSAILVYNFSLYFGVAANSREYYYAFRSDLTAVSEYLSSCRSQGNLYLSLDKFSVQTVDYLTTGIKRPYYLLDPAKTYEVTLKRGDRVIFTQSTLYDRILFLKYHPTAKLILEEKNKFGEPIMLVYEAS
jgi:4-amino-4-deoxy-L-arabinose transferase-like glycosyltransferase